MCRCTAASKSHLYTSKVNTVCIVHHIRISMYFNNKNRKIKENIFSRTKKKVFSIFLFGNFLSNMYNVFSYVFGPYMYNTCMCLLLSRTIRYDTCVHELLLCYSHIRFIFSGARQHSFILRSAKIICMTERDSVL